MEPELNALAPVRSSDEVDLPKLAVVITCYNYEAYVGRAIRSVLDEGRADCELVVIDDGSTDHSWEVIRQSGAAGFKIRNSGQRAACLQGADLTRAPYVLFLDADDELAPGALDEIIPRLDGKIAKLQFPLTPIDAKGRDLGAPRPRLKAFRGSRTVVREILRTGVYTSPPTSGNVFRRDVCEVLRDAHYDHAVDGVILFAAPFFGDVLSLSQPLGRYRIHDRNDSGVGRPPEAAVFRRDLKRFSYRMAHLRSILLQVGCDQRLVSPRKVFYFREACFWLTVASGKRPPLLALPGLLASLLRQHAPPTKKAALASFFMLASVLPDSSARFLLDRRYVGGMSGGRVLRKWIRSLRARKSAPPDPRLSPSGETRGRASSA
jgi:glycosyltransferase involved in cell wall biosynthesis